MCNSLDRLENILSQLEARSSDEHVFSVIYAQEAKQEAKASDKRMAHGQRLSPLDGRIVSIKDLFDVAGEPTLAGSVIRQNADAASEDAAIVKRLRKAGAVIIGKTHMTEFAFTPMGLNPHYGEAGNAVDPSRVAGGSSTGAAVSVAEGTSVIAIGSDTGGSVRIPAALNGIVGFKPTAQRVPLQGAFPLSPSLDSIGPLAKNVADCILADAVMAGKTPILPAALPLDALTLALPVGSMLDDLEPTIARGFAKTVDALQRAGANIVEIHLDDLIMRLRDATRETGSIAGVEARRVHASTWLNDPDANVDIHMKKPLQARFNLTDEAYFALLETRKRLIQDMDTRLKAVDAFITPTTAIFAPEIALVKHNKITHDRAESLLLRNTQVSNQFDLCSISLPMPDMELPAGFMLSARGQTDERLLAAALSVERFLS